MSSELLLEPDAFAYGGKSVATMPSGKRCFIRGGVPGDSLRAVLRQEKKSYAEAEIIEIVKPSPKRIVPVCPFAADRSCPGCAYAQVDYSVELEWKQRQFERFLLHSGIVTEREILAPAGAAQRTGWRNKIKLTADKKRPVVKTGYLMDDNRTVLDLRDCLLARPEISRLMRETLSSGEFRDSLPEGRSTLTFRFTPHDGALLLEREKANGFLLDSIPPYGDFHVPRFSFFQINTAMMSRLAAEFIRIAGELKPELFIELYCGCGVFSVLAVEAGIGKVYGSEIDSDSIAAAERNLHEHGVPHCRFLSGDAAKALGQLPLKTARRTLLLVDPPRAGLDPKVVDALNRSSVRDLIYVSCAPDTLARDLVRLGAHGWRVVSARLFDLFPSTSHFESMTLLNRANRSAAADE